MGNKLLNLLLQIAKDDSRAFVDRGSLRTCDHLPGQQVLHPAELRVGWPSSAALAPLAPSLANACHAAANRYP